MGLYRSELEDRFAELSPIMIVNTWRTKNQNWSVANVRIYGVEFLENIKELVMSLPVRVNLPKYVSELSFPRYYAIFYDERSKLEIKDIVGIRRDATATKWSYRFGYWHPKIQEYITRAIEEELKELRKQQTQTQQ